jgi:hypothetical protein
MAWRGGNGISMAWMHRKINNRKWRKASQNGAKRGAAKAAANNRNNHQRNGKGVISGAQHAAKNNGKRKASMKAAASGVSGAGGMAAKTYRNSKRRSTASLGGMALIIATSRAPRAGVNQHRLIAAANLSCCGARKHQRARAARQAAKKAAAAAYRKSASKHGRHGRGARHGMAA